MNTKISSFTMRFQRVFLMLATLFVGATLSSEVPAQSPAVRFVGIVPTVGAPGEWSGRIVEEGCDAVVVPPIPPQAGGLLQVDVSGSTIELRVGFVGGGIIAPCSSPTNPLELLPVPLGPLIPGNYQLILIGVTQVTSGTFETNLGTYSVMIPFPPRQVPTGGFLLPLLLIALLGCVGLRRLLS